MSCLSNAVTLDCCNLLPNRFTKGDLYAVDANGVIQALAIGANGNVLTADSAKPLGMDWKTAAGISGLTTDFIPIATSATSIGDGPQRYRTVTGLTYGVSTPIFNVAIPASDFSYIVLTYVIWTLIGADVYAKGGVATFRAATNDAVTYQFTTPLQEVGAFTSITNTGSISSLVPWQIASPAGGIMQASLNPTAALITPTTYNVRYKIDNINGKTFTALL